MFLLILHKLLNSFAYMLRTREGVEARSNRKLQLVKLNLFNLIVN